MTKARIVGATLLAAGCWPDFGADPALVSAPRIIAVKAEPAEAAPGDPARYEALVADPTGAAANGALHYSYCTAPKPLAENNAVSAACLDASALVPAGEGLEVTAPLPEDACALFGPDVQDDGSRPRDPDRTGGYYQPLRVDLAHAEAVFHLTRLLCGLGSAPQEVAAEFARAVRPNQNPRLAALSITERGNELSPDRLPASSELELTASWPAEAAESYPVFDPATQTLVTRREALSVAWFTSAGHLEVESSGRAENDLQQATQNRWRTPNQSGRAWLWIVLRDGRGGVDYATLEANVRISGSDDGEN